MSNIRKETPEEFHMLVIFFAIIDKKGISGIPYRFDLKYVIVHPKLSNTYLFKGSFKG